MCIARKNENRFPERISEKKKLRKRQDISRNMAPKTTSISSWDV